MKNNSRTHGNKGRVGYRTPSNFRFESMRRGADLRAGARKNKYAPYNNRQR